MADLIPSPTSVMPEGGFFHGIHTSGIIPEKYLLRGIDNLGKMAFITRGHTKFLHMFTNVLGTGTTKNDREFRTHELTEMDRIFHVAVDQTDSTLETLWLTPEAVVQLQPNDVLYSRSKYVQYEVNDTVPIFSNTFGYNYADETKNQFFTENEQMLVIDVDRTPVDKSGVTACKVTVIRCFKGKGKKDMMGTIRTGALSGDSVANAAYKKDDILMRGLPSFPEGSGAPSGFGKMPSMENNFTQEFKYAIEITREAETVKHILGKTPMEIYKLLKARQSALDIERQMLFGQKGRRIDGEGRLQCMMGGVIEYINKDLGHVHNYKAIVSGKSTVATPAISTDKLTYEGLLDVLNCVAQDGGSSERTLYTGISLYTEFKKSFNDKGIIRISPEETNRYDIPIEVIVGAGIQFKIVPLYTFEENGWGNKGLLLDDSSASESFSPVTYKGWDMIIEDISPNDKSIKKEQWLGIKGLERRKSPYHHILDFTNAALSLNSISNIIK